MKFEELAKTEDQCKWLIVSENVADIAQIRRFLRLRKAKESQYEVIILEKKAKEDA